MSVLELPAADYHADTLGDEPSLSASIATILWAKSPAHAYAAHPRLNPDLVREESDAFDIGTVVHSLLLENVSRIEVIIADNWRTKVAQEQRAEARAAGQIPLLQKDAERALAMVEAAKVQMAEFQDRPPLLSLGKPEQTLVWDDSGVSCKARIDWLRDDYTVVDDVKTSQSADPTWFSEKGIYNYGYDIRAAFYVRGVKAVTGVEPTFRWIVQEKTAPYALSVVGAGADVLESGARKVQYAIDLWRGCLETGDWPGYPTRVCWAELPAWEDTRRMAKEVREGIAA